MSNSTSVFFPRGCAGYSCYFWASRRLTAHGSRLTACALTSVFSWSDRDFVPRAWCAVQSSSCDSPQHNTASVSPPPVRVGEAQRGGVLRWPPPLGLAWTPVLSGEGLVLSGVVSSGTRISLPSLLWAFIFELFQVYSHFSCDLCLVCCHS